MQNKHIALLVARLTMGGVQKTRIQLAKSLLEKDFQVDFFYKTSGDLQKELPEQVNAIPLNSEKSWQQLLQILIYIWQYKPSVLLASSRSFNPILIWAKRLAGYPLIILASFHDACSFASLHRIKKRAKRVSQSYQQLDGLISVSQGIAKDCSQVLGIELNRFKVLYNPVVSKDIFLKAEQAIIHPWFKDKTTSLIIAIGRLERQKRFEHLIQAFHIIQDKTTARLVILGEGSERNHLESLIAELHLKHKIDLPGFVENPFSYLKQADLFVLSSEHEGLPGVLIQALALGTPVVATDCISGPREILQGGKYGDLVPVGDINALAMAMLNTLSHPLETPFLQQAAEPFKVETTIQAYIDYLEGYLCKSR